MVNIYAVVDVIVRVSISVNIHDYTNLSMHRIRFWYLSCFLLFNSDRETIFRSIFLSFFFPVPYLTYFLILLNFLPIFVISFIRNLILPYITLPLYLPLCLCLCLILYVTRWICCNRLKSGTWRTLWAIILRLVGWIPLWYSRLLNGTIWDYRAR